MRLPFYLPQSLAALIRFDLRHNPYLHDAGVHLPIWGVWWRLMAQACVGPKTGAAFGAFLLEYRPLRPDPTHPGRCGLARRSGRALAAAATGRRGL